MHTSPPTPAPPDEATCLAALDLACQRVGVPFDPALALSAARGGGLPDPRWGRLPGLAEALRLRLTPDRGSLDELRARARPDLPALLRTQEGGLVLVLDAAGPLVQTQRPGQPPRWQRRSTLLALVDGEPDAATWLWVEPLAPAAPLLGTTEDGPAEHVPAGQRLRALLRAEREDLRVVLLYAVAVGLLSLGTPLAVQVLINTVAFGALRQPVAVLALLLAATLTLGAALRALQRVVIEVLQRRVFVRLVADLAWRLPRVSLDALERSRGAELVNRFFDVVTVQKAASSLLLDGLAAVLQALVGLVLLALYHPLLLAFDLFLLLAIAVLLFGAGTLGPKTAITESKAKYAVAGWLEELARHSRSFRGPGGEDWAARQADLLACGYLASREQHFRVYFRQFVGVLGLQVVAGTALLAGGGLLVLERQLTLGQLVAAELIVATALAGVAKVAEKLEGFYDLLAALDKLGQLVEQPLDPSGHQDLPAQEPSGAELDLHALEVDGLAGPPLTLTLEPGEPLAVLGAEGQGKTRLVQVLAGQRAQRAGQIRLCGVALGDLRRDALRGAVGVLERAELLDGTVDQNLTLDRVDLPAEARWAALRAVGLEEVVRALPQGLHTPLGEGGLPLSELGALRLCLARVMLARPRLLLLDGVLDRFPSESRDALLDALTAGPWTLVLTTRDAALARSLPLTLDLSEGRLRRARRTSATRSGHAG